MHGHVRRPELEREVLTGKEVQMSSVIAVVSGFSSPSLKKNSQARLV